MAYMNQEKKKKLAPAIKEVLKKYGMKGTIGVSNHSTLVVNIKSGELDIVNNYAKKSLSELYKTPDHLREHVKNSLETLDHIDVNVYWIEDHYEGTDRDFLLELKKAMMVGNHDNSDIQTDYFDVGWYIDINIGNWNKPYVCTKEK